MVIGACLPRLVSTQDAAGEKLEGEINAKRSGPLALLPAGTRERVTLRFQPEGCREALDHNTDRRNLLKEWLLRLASNQQPSG
jgi:hypothetical protein